MLSNTPMPPNSITVSRVDTTTGQLLKPLVMLQPLPLGPYGFMEKLWPSYTNMNTTNEPKAVENCMYHLDNTAVVYSSSQAPDYTRYTIDDSLFKKRHIQERNRHIIIPTDALQTRSLICLMYEGGLYQKAHTGSFDVIRWFMLLPSSRVPALYPIEIQLQPNDIVSASIRTQYIHDAGYKPWTIEFEEPEILTKYITTYTEHVVTALERSRAQDHATDSRLYTAQPIVVADRFNKQYSNVNITTSNVDASLLDKLRKSFGI